MKDSKDPIRLRAIVLDSGDNGALMDFYHRLLGPGWIREEDAEWPCIHREGLPWILFQQAPDHVPPVWPDKEGEQRQMTHLDFSVDDMKSAVAYAVSCGATVAPAQFSEYWTVLFDPAGHPFCLVQDH